MLSDTSNVQPVRHHPKTSASYASNPWIFLNPSCANALLTLSFVFVFVVDIVIISIHWNISPCSNVLKLWIIGKYFAPLLSYISCCLFVPCNLDETMDVTTSIPYSQHELRQKRIRQTVFTNPITQIRAQNNPETQNKLSNDNQPQTHNKTHKIHLTNNDNKSMNNCCDCLSRIPYPYDIMLSEWCVSPSTVTSNIASSVDGNDCFCKTYVYTIGIIFDRGILELLWLFIGGLTVIYQDVSCHNQTPVLYYYVLLQIIMGGVITVILLCWMITSSLCPLTVARVMACCYGMECDLLGLLPRNAFKNLLTISNINFYNKNATNQKPRNNYHTLSTLPHHYEYNNRHKHSTNEIVELVTANCNTNGTKHKIMLNEKMNENKNTQRVMCLMCDNSMKFLSENTKILDCGHEYHSVCVDEWPVNLKCPQCIISIEKMRKNEEIDDSDTDLDACDTSCEPNNDERMPSSMQLL